MPSEPKVVPSEPKVVPGNPKTMSSDPERRTNASQMIPKRKGFPSNQVAARKQDAFAGGGGGSGWGQACEYTLRHSLTTADRRRGSGNFVLVLARLLLKGTLPPKWGLRSLWRPFQNVSDFFSQTSSFNTPRPRAAANGIPNRAPREA